PFDARRFANLCGQFDEHLRQVEKRLGITLRNRGNQFELLGDPERTQDAERVLRLLWRETQSTELSPDLVHLFLQESGVEALAAPETEEVTQRTRKGQTGTRAANPQGYAKANVNAHIDLGIGQPGTAKAYLALACAVDALERQQIRRMLLVRPAV